MTRPHLALHDRAVDGREYGCFRSDGSSFLELGNLLVAAAENAQAIARGLQRRLGSARIILRVDQIRLRLLPVFQGDGLALVEGTEPVLDCLRQPELRVGLIERGNRRNEIVVDLHRVGGFEDEQRLSARHHTETESRVLDPKIPCKQVEGRR